MIRIKVQDAGSDVGELFQPLSENYNMDLRISPDNDFAPMPPQQEYAEYYTSGSSTVAPSGDPLLDTPPVHIPKATSPFSDSMAGFFVGSLLPTSEWQSAKMPQESSWVSKISTYSAGIVTINAPLLLQIITHNSFCLGCGPGYLRSSMDHVINALTIDRLLFQ